MDVRHARPTPEPRFLTPLPPLPPVLLPRSALVDRVLSTPPGGCCAVSAAPGYGRTTLLSLAARRCSGVVAWTSAGPWPDDPDSFLAHVIEVVDPDTAGRPVTVRALVSALAGHDVAASGVLVVDDLDSLEQPRLADALTTLADMLPADWRLLVGMRRAILPALARLRTSGRLVTIDEADLALTRQESVEFVRLVDPVRAPAVEDRLVDLAGGWPAALVEALRGPAAADAGDPSGWLLDIGIDRLLEPVLDEMPQDDLDFLVRCSVLETLDADACTAMTGDPDAASRLRRLEAGRWYLRRVPGTNRLAAHGLLAEHLRRRLAAQGSHAVAEARRQAAAFAASAGDTATAVRHLMEADDYGRALDLVEAALESVMDRGGFETVRGWYERVPVEVHRRHIHLLGDAWSSLLVGDLPCAERALAELETAVSGDAGATAAPAAGSGSAYGEPGWLAAQVHVLRAYRGSWLGRLGRMRREAEEARTLFGDAWGAMAPRVALLLLIRERLWLEDLAAARPLVADTVGRAGSPEFQRRVSFPSEQALLAAVEGRPRRAAYLAGQVLDYLEREGERYPAGPLQARLARARALVDLGEAGRAMGDADAVAGWGDAAENVTYACLGRLARARALAATGEYGRAHEQLGEAATLLRSAAPGSPLLQEVLALEAALRLDCGDVVAAERLIRRLPRHNRQAILRIRLVQSRRPGSGLPDLAALQPQSPREAAQRAVLVAAAGFANGRIAEAERHLAAAGDNAEETGLVSTLVGASPGLVDFADRIAARGGYRGLAGLVAVSQQWRAASTTPAGERPLSPGELELLALLQDRPGNEDLARSLGVSVNTVKTRLQRLYRKLGVSSRSEALRQARDLRLVSPGPGSVTRAG